ncbi:MAG: glycosyltransferase family 39 protein [Pseudomonadota bacterium]
MKTFIRKVYDSRFYLPGLFMLYFILAGVLIYIVDYWPKGEIEALLKRWVPWNLRANLVLLVIGIIACRRDIAASFRGLSAAGGVSYLRRNYKGLLLIALVLSAFFMTAFVAPRIHRIFYDEDIYASMGQVIAMTGQTGMCHYGTQDYGEFNAAWLSYYKEPSGWPFLMSLVFQLFGTNELYAFFLNNVIFAAGVLAVFFITRILTGGYFPAFLAGLVFALIPHNLTWSNTAAAEPSAALLAGLVVLCLAVYLKTGAVRHLFTLAAVVPIACQMRPESGLILLWAVITVAILCASPVFSRGTGRGEDGGSDTCNKADRKSGGRGTGFWSRREVWTAGLLGLFFLMPHLLHLFAMGGQSWGATGAKFSTEFFWNHLSVNGLYYLNNDLFPAAFTVLAVVGLLFARLDLRWRLMVFVWFLLFWGIFLFFYAGSYRYGADVRFALLSFMPIAVLAGMGGERVRSWIGRAGSVGMSEKTAGVLIVLVLMFTWMPYLPLVRAVGQEAWGARYDHRHAREFIKKIPPRAIVLTHNATMFLVWGQNAIQAYAGIRNPDIVRNLMETYQGHVYFHYGYWCNIPTDGNKQLCEDVMARYNMEEIASASEQAYRYGLYKMSKK